MAEFMARQIQTRLAVSDIGSIFRDNIQGVAKGFFMKEWSKKLAWQFSTPEETDDPFAAFASAGTPEFRVMANHRLAKKGFFTSDSTAESFNGWIALDVWEKRQFRMATIGCPNTLGPNAQVRLVVDRLTRKDPGVRVTEKIFS
jgi:hypothetical protein